MAKFKIGDKVIRKHGTNSTTPIGFVGKITYIESQGTPFEKLFFGSPNLWGCNDNGQWALVDQADLITEAVRLLEESGYEVVAPKPKLTGKVVIIMTPSGNVHAVPKDRYDRKDFSLIVVEELAIVDWTEGEGV